MLLTLFKSKTKADRFQIILREPSPAICGENLPVYTPSTIDPGCKAQGDRSRAMRSGFSPGLSFFFDESAWNRMASLIALA